MIIGVPGVGDDDVVEGRVALAEARETNFENHGEWSCVLSFFESRWSTVSILRRLSSTAAAKDDFRNEGTTPRTATPDGCGQTTLSSASLLLHIPILSLSLCFSLSHFRSHDRFWSQLIVGIYTTSRDSPKYKYILS